MTQKDIKFKDLEHKLINNPLPVDVILVNVKVVDLKSKNSSEFNDPNNFPFYYRLSSYFHFEVVEQIGSQLGLIGAAYMRGSRDIKEWKVGLENTLIRSIIESNLKINCKGKIGFFEPQERKDHIQLNDAAFLTEKYSEDDQLRYMEFLWNGLKSGGLLFVDYLNDKQVRELFLDFCSVKNRESFIFSTRNRIGVVER